MSRSDAAPPAGKCPFGHGANLAQGGAPSSSDKWWPEAVNLRILHQQPSEGDPMGAGFDYRKEFKTLDLTAVKADLASVMTTSQEWWPADYGTYAPFMVRLTWHAAGTYRVGDGRGGGGTGQQRFDPLASWPDNGNLDKARRLLWPVKRKYGRKISWADLLLLAGNVALETMGFETFGFAGGRPDVWQPEDDTYWGPETEWLGDKRYTGDRQLETTLGAVQMGLIYVNPEGPNGNPDPVAAGHDIRETFARMAMNDEETVALIAGGHTFGKTHGAADPDKHVGREPGGAPLEEQGFGWKNSHGTGKGGDAITSGLEGAWTVDPARWDNGFFHNLFAYEWEKFKSPAGATQWRPTDKSAHELVPDAHDASKRHPPVMLTTDLALRFDPAYEKISRRFQANPKEFADAFGRAWYKLLHRDMGPVSRLLGPEVPPAQLWQDPVPAVDHPLVDAADAARLKAALLASSGLSAAQLALAAFASASSFRGTDFRGGANGARVRLAPQKDWAVNDPEALAASVAAIDRVRGEFNASLGGGKRVSLADAIVLAGCAAVEEAARAAGHDGVEVPFAPGRTDATAEQTDADSFAVLEPTACGFRNYRHSSHSVPAEKLLVERAFLLRLTAPEMTVLLGGMRALGANAGGTKHGVFTERPGALTTDFFVNLLDMSTAWTKAGDDLYEGRDRDSGSLRWTATGADLVFGSNAQLRALAEVYAADDAKAKFVADFVAVWAKVMNLDRFDLE